MAESLGGGEGGASGAPWLSPRAASLRRRRRTRSGGERAPLSPASLAPVIPSAPSVGRQASKRARVALKKQAGGGVAGRGHEIDSESSGEELDEDDLAEMQAMRQSLANAIAKEPGMAHTLDCEVIRPIGRGMNNMEDEMGMKLDRVRDERCCIRSSFIGSAAGL